MSGAPRKQDFRFMYPLLTPRQKYVVFMATPSVDQRRFYRFLMNKSLQVNMSFFSHLVIERYWRHDFLKLPYKKLKVIDPGFYDFGFAAKDFSSLRLVYVGVLCGRGIENTIEGLALFIHRNSTAKITYDIFGKAKPSEIYSLRKVISKHSLSSTVKCHGFLTQSEGSRLIQGCNVGVAYTANTGYYGHSSAKTLEYLIAGLPVIATSSPFKNDFINDSNGVIHDDNPEDFSRALEIVYSRRFEYMPEKIREVNLHFSMDKIVKNQIVTFFNLLMQDQYKG